MQPRTIPSNLWVFRPRARQTGRSSFQSSLQAMKTLVLKYKLLLTIAVCDLLSPLPQIRTLRMSFRLSTVQRKVSRCWPDQTTKIGNSDSSFFLNAVEVSQVLKVEEPAAVAATRPKWYQNDRKVNSRRVGSLLDECLEIVRAKQTEQTMWKALEESFAKKIASSQTLLRKLLPDYGRRKVRQCEIISKQSTISFGSSRLQAPSWRRPTWCHSCFWPCWLVMTPWWRRLKTCTRSWLLGQSSSDCELKNRSG